MGPTLSERCRGSAAKLVVADRRYQVYLRAGSGERHGLVGSRPAGGNDDLGRCIAAPVEGPKGEHDNVDHDVADDDHYWSLPLGSHPWAA